MPFEEFLPSHHRGGLFSFEIAEDSKGFIYVCNEAGLLRYNGQSWSKMPPTGYNSGLVAVDIDPQDRIWIGGSELLGYYESRENGAIEYTDLTHKMQEVLQGDEFGKIWSIHTTGEVTYIITNFHVIIHTNDSWKTHRFDVAHRVLPSWINDTLYIHARGDGFFRFEGQNPMRILPEHEAIASGVVSILSADDSVYRVGTLLNGVWRIENGLLTNEAGNPDPGNFSLDYIKLDSETTLIAQSTGLFALHKNGKVKKVNPSEIVSLNRLLKTDGGSIWASSLKSIIRLPDTIYSRFDFSASQIDRYGDALILRSEGGIKQISGGNEKVLTSDWASNPIYRNEHIIYAEATKLKAIKGESVQSEVRLGSLVSMLMESPWHEDIFYSSDDPEMSRWRADRGGLKRLSQTIGSKKIFQSMAEVCAHTTLYSTNNRDIGLISWPDEESGTPEIEVLTSAESLPENLKYTKIIQFGKRALLATDKGLFEFEPNERQFIQIKAVEGPLGQISSDLVTSPTLKENGLIVYARDSSYLAGYKLGLLEHDDATGYTWTPIHLAGLREIGTARDFLHEERKGKEILWVAGLKKTLRYDLSDSQPSPALRTNITAIEETFEKVRFYEGHGPIPQKPSLPYPQKSLRFDFSSPESSIGRIGSQKRLIGFDEDWSDVIDFHYWEFGNLHEGNYRFEVRAIDEFGRAGPTTSFEFIILPPWYRTPVAYTAYAFLIILAATFLSKWFTDRLRKRTFLLERIVNQRTYELERSNQELRRANSVKQEFLANMSHEIRNPLNGIMGISRIMEESGCNKERIGFLNANARHLNQLLEQVLDYSYIESGKVEIRSVPFDARALAQDVIDMHRILAEEKCLNLTSEFPAISHKWIGDPVLVKQILVNLLSNAIEYTPNGSVHFNIRTIKKGKIVKAVFSIEDTGPGIPEDQREYIFGSFTRLENPNHLMVSGAGLGLAIAGELSRKMGGQVSLDENYQKGSRFLLEVEFEQSAIEATGSTHSSSQELNKVLKGKHVLVADDMEFNRYICTRLFEELGASVQEAKDGTEALDALCNKQFEIAVLDISMPNKSGIEVVVDYLTNAKPPLPMLIALSAHAGQASEKAALEAGFSAFIEKPLDSDKLLSSLSKQLSPPKASKSADLLNYLSQEDPDKSKELEKRFADSLEETLAGLERHIKSSDSREAHRSLHKVRGLINLRRTEITTRLIDTISEQIDTPESTDTCLKLCAELRNTLTSAHEQKGRLPDPA